MHMYAQMFVFSRECIFFAYYILKQAKGYQYFFLKKYLCDNKSIKNNGTLCACHYLTPGIGPWGIQENISGNTSE